MLRGAGPLFASLSKGRGASRCAPGQDAHRRAARGCGAGGAGHSEGGKAAAFEVSGAHLLSVSVQRERWGWLSGGCRGRLRAEAGCVSGAVGCT